MWKLGLLLFALGAYARMDLNLDHVHGFRVEYDDLHDILLFLNSTDCYIVEAPDSSWDAITNDDASTHKETSAIYAHIENNVGVTSLTRQEAFNAYHSRLEQWQCRDKDVHKVDYTPTTYAP